MTWSEKLALILFLLVVVGIYVEAGGILIRMLLRRHTRRLHPNLPIRPRRRSKVWLERAVLLLACLGALCFVYGYAIEPRWLEVSTVRATTARLPKGAEPIRIVHLSDLHCEGSPGLAGRLPAVVAGLKPDLIVFMGDAANSEDGVPVFRRCMAELARLAPTFAVRGNLYGDDWPGPGLYGDTGVRVLDGEAAKLTVRGRDLWLAGEPDDRRWSVADLLGGIPPDAPAIVLCHRPDLIYDVARHARPADLYCAGHTHGGQIALPFYGAIITLSESGKRFEAGLYRVERTWLYVNRGIGLEGGLAPRMRFFARPEVTLIELAPE